MMKVILLAAVLLNVINQIVMTPVNNNNLPPVCYNQTSSNIISPNNCTCTTGTCMSNNFVCPCQQTAILNCLCVYLSQTPCNT